MVVTASRALCAGVTTRIASWPRVTPNDRFTITLGGSHWIYVAASMGATAAGAGGAHVVVAFDRQGRAQSIVAGPGALTSGLIHASDRGLTRRAPASWCALEDGDVAPPVVQLDTPADAEVLT